MKKYKISEERFNQVYNETNYEIDFPFIISKYRNVEVGRLTDLVDDTTQHIIYENFYKFDNELQRDIVMILLQSDYNFLGYTGTFFFSTREKGQEQYEGESINLTNGLSGKTSFVPEIKIFHTDKYAKNSEAIEMVIDGYLMGYQSEETLFQGWIESLEEFKIIWKCVGLQ